MAVYNGEIDSYTGPYGYTLLEQTLASIINCVAGIGGSLLIGKYLDRTRAFKRL